MLETAREILRDVNTYDSKGERVPSELSTLKAATKVSKTISNMDIYQLMNFVMQNPYMLTQSQYSAAALAIRNHASFLQQINDGSQK